MLQLVPCGRESLHLPVDKAHCHHQQHNQSADEPEVQPEPAVLLLAHGLISEVYQ